MLRQVVVDDERVLALVEEVLAHRAAGERRHPLDRRGLVRGRGDDRRVRHRARFLQPLVHLHDRRRLLADRDVEALHVLVVLVEDRVDRDRRLARRAVADDQLALAAADVRHRVDRLDAGLQRLLHRLPRDHARRLELERPRLVRVDRALAVERVPERVDDAAEQRLADGNARDAAGAAHRLALADVLPLAEERDADVVLLEVEREPDDAVLELEHLRARRRSRARRCGRCRRRPASTVPTSERSVSTSYCSILDLRICVISSGRSFKASPISLSSVLYEVVRGGRARSRRRAASRPGGRCRRSGPGRRCASRRRGGRTPARSGRRSAAPRRRRARTPSSARP